MRYKTVYLALIFIVLSAAQPSPALAQDSGPVYVVQAGDTLSGIARRFGVSQTALIEANAIQDPARLFPGERLLLPGFEGIFGELTLRSIALGETVESLALEYTLKPVDLARLNRMVRLDGAYVGQAMIVPNMETSGSAGVDQAPELSRLGSSSLEYAVRAGVSPWQVVKVSDADLQKWFLPGHLDQEGTAAFTLQNLVGDLTISPSPLVQGKTAIIDLQDTEGFSVFGRLGEHDLQFFPYESGRMIALQGVHALQEPGLLDLVVELWDEGDDRRIFGFNQRVLIDEGDYGFRVLNGVPPETVDPANTRPEDTLIQSLLEPRSAEKLWQGTFDLPSRYYTEEFISLFGTRRNYNNGALLHYHTGLDFYGQNVPIYSPADGIVVFADALTVRGNATYIDHGWGVYSGYLHQSEMTVEVGERVERGQVIGQVGATGRVTGPHLHWEIWVGGIPVEPLDWVIESIP